MELVSPFPKPNQRSFICGAGQGKFVPAIKGPIGGITARIPPLKGAECTWVVSRPAQNPQPLFGFRSFVLGGERPQKVGNFRAST